MRTDLLDIIACPLCKGELDLQATEIAAEGSRDSGEVLTGTLICESLRRTLSDHRRNPQPIAAGLA